MLIVSHLKIHWKQHWARYLIGIFVLFQFGDVIFGEGTLNTLKNSPAGFIYHIPKYHGLFEGGSLNRFPRQQVANRGFWDRPMVNDPNIKAANDLLLKGEFPWLNPYLGLGVPLFANGISPTFFIGNLFFIFFNSQYWDLFYLGLFFLSGLLLFQIFSRYYNFDAKASLVGSLIYLSSGLFAPQMTYMNAGEALNIYLFIIGIYFIEVFRRSESWFAKFGSAFAISVCSSQAVYAAMPEATVATYFMLCGYMLLRLPLAPRQYLWQSGLWIFFIFSSSLLISAPYLTALYYNSNLIEFSHKVGHVVIPPRYLIDTFLPYFRGWTENDFFPSHFPNQLNVIFLGIAPLLVFLFWISHLSEFQQKKKWLPFFLVIIFYWSQSFGPETINLNFVGLLPIVNRIWFWRFFPSIYVFAVCLLTVKVLHDLLCGNITSFKYRFLGLLGFGVLAYYWFLSSSASYVAGVNQDPTFVAKFFTWNRANTSAVILFALLFSFWSPFFQKFYWWQKARNVWGTLLVILVFMVSSYNFSKSFYRKQDAFAEIPSLTFLKQKLKEGEFFRIYSANVFFPSTAAGYGISDIRYMIPITPQNTVSALSLIFGKYGKGQVEWDRFESIHELDGIETYNHPGFDLLNVRYFIFPSQYGFFPSGTRFLEGFHDQEQSIFHVPPFLKPGYSTIPFGENFREVYRGKHASIIENLNVKERFFFVPEWEVISEMGTLYQTIQDNPQILFKKAFLSSPPVWPNLNLPPVSSSLLPRLLGHTNHSYQLEIQLRDPQILVISDTYYEGHTASINGQEILVQSVNGGIIGVPLPAGKYQMDLRFEHPFLPISMFLLGLGCLIVLIVCFVGWKKYSSPEANPPSTLFL